jgi:hypothetical protein
LGWTHLLGTDSLDPSSIRHRGPALVVTTALALLGSSCGGPTEPFDRDVRGVDRRWVVDGAAEALGRDGRFDFDPLPSAVGELSREASIELATAAIRHIAGAIGGAREYIERQHGAPINWTRLAACGRIVPVFANLTDPGQTVPHYVRTPMGPSYIVPFCSESGARSVSVDVYVRTLARVRADGSIEFPTPGGTEFTVFGISSRPTPYFTPEFGARLVYLRLKTRIRSVPELDGCVFALTICHGLLGRHWKFRVEAPLRVRSASGSILETDEFYTPADASGLDRETVYVAAQDQPTPKWQLYPVVHLGEPGGTDSVLLSVARPLLLETFKIVK